MIIIDILIPSPIYTGYLSRALRAGGTSLSERRSGLVLGDDTATAPPWTPGPGPKFLKRYADLRTVLTDAVTAYTDDVREGRYPAAEHGYS